MALRELPTTFRRLAVEETRSSSSFLQTCRRYASTEAAANNASQDTDLESTATFSPISTNEQSGTYDPIKRAKERTRELPSGRYVCCEIKTKLDPYILLDTSIDHQDISVDHYIPTNLPQNRTQHHENLFRDPSTILDWSKPSNP